MAFTGTSLLSLPIITTGTESGAWGNITNNGLTQYLDTSIAGALSITSSITLANTSGDATGTNLTSTTAQYRTLVVPASGPSANIVITAPSSNRTYHVVNRNATYTVQIRAGTNSGVTLGVNQSATVTYNSTSTDYELVGTSVPILNVDNLRLDGNTISSTNTNGTITIAPNGTGDVVAQVNATNVFSVSSTFGFKNRIINGGMVIDQRNAGAAVTVNTDGVYPVDRFYCSANASGVFTADQVSTTPTGAGFTNSVLLTVTTARSSIAATDVYGIRQAIEGFNTADLGFGTASAQSVTLSFWVRSSITGTYAVSFFNNAFNRSYVATYTVSAANTWEQKTVTISGDTSGTWTTDNTAGLIVLWDLGSGSNYNGTAGSWAAASATRTSGSTNWISTNGATFYITGVQLEKGSTATSFDFRDYGRELIMCQRYCEVLTASSIQAVMGAFVATAYVPAYYSYKVTKRAIPTVSTPTWSTSNTNTPAIQSNTTEALIYYAEASAVGNSVYNNTTQINVTSEL
jgi:hypothetical protein